jgi:DNA-binding MurR/RpiR family transcriptional regulator
MDTKPPKKKKPTSDRPDGGKAAASRPNSVEQLRALAILIGRGEAEVSLGSKAHTVLAKLVDRPEEVAVRTITELADALGVNASTLTRLATRLGYEGFVDFQTVFRDSLAQSHRHFYSQQAERLAAGVSARASAPRLGQAGPQTETVMHLARESLTNVEGFLSQLSEDDLGEAAKLLANAPRVRIFGLRQFHALASFMTYALGMIRPDVDLLDAAGLGVAEGLAQLQPGDVVLVTSVAPYTRSVAQVAAAASKAGLTVIAITDTRSSPLVPPSRYAFFIPHKSSFFSNSMGAYVVFCEGLMNLVATQLGKKALKALERREHFITSLNIEMG